MDAQLEAITELRSDMNRLRGRLFQFVEACGLPDKQASAMKGCIRTLTYESQATLEASLRLNGNSQVEGESK